MENPEVIEEKLVLKELLKNRDYFNQCFPYLDENLFTESKIHKYTFQTLKKYVEKYNDVKSFNLSVLNLELKELVKNSPNDLLSVDNFISYVNKNEEYNIDWLKDSTLQFIKSKKYYNCLSNAAANYAKSKLDETLPDQLNSIFSIGFDTDFVSSLSDNLENRWEQYTIKEEKIPFLVSKLNDITKGGLSPKTLNCLMSTTSGGFKSGTLCSLSADYIREGYNVLYITLEMSEAKILERIDANLLDTPIDNISKLGKETYINKMTEITNKFHGKLYVKQFPTTQCNVYNLRSLLNDLKNKLNFIPQILIVDYMGLMNSIRYKNEAEHIILKSISEELRGLCVEFNLIGWTASQSNRQGLANGATMEMNDISGSYGVTFTFDMLLAIISTPEFDNQNKILFKQLKNRYGDANLHKTFFLGINKSEMKIFDMLNLDSADNIDEELNNFEGKENTSAKVQKAMDNSFKEKYDFNTTNIRSLGGKKFMLKGFVFNN